MVSVLGLFAAVKALQFAIIYFTPNQFDTLSQLLLAAHHQSRVNLCQDWKVPEFAATILDKLITWDSVYFNHLYVDDIHYEHEFVFCPFWWRLVKYFPVGGDDYYKKALLAVVMLNMFHWLTVVMVMALTKVYFSLGFLSQRPKFVDTVGALYILLPAGVFLTAGYSENFANFLAMTTLYLHSTSITADYLAKSKVTISHPWRYLASGLVAALNVGVRANTVFLGVLYLVDLYRVGWVNRRLFQTGLVIVSGAVAAAVLAGLNLYLYLLFCPQRGLWCNWQLPLFFKFAQSNYWGVGFLKYWTPNNIPNFLFAAPTATIMAGAIHFYVKQLPRHPRLLSIIIISFITLAGGLFWWNTQILTRMAWFSPLAVWYVATMITSVPASWRGRWFVYYSLVWVPTQTALFAAFVPPA